MWVTDYCCVNLPRVSVSTTEKEVDCFCVLWGRGAECRAEEAPTHVELQALGPLSNDAVARPAHVAPLVLKEVVASGGVAVTVERH